MSRILVVEDEIGYRNLLHDQLTKTGYEVISAKDGEEGLKLAREMKPSLILLDLLMPKVDGLTMLKALREDEWGKNVIVFVLTNVNESKEISETMNDKVTKYIIKSDWKLEDIIDEIGLHFEGR